MKTVKLLTNITEIQYHYGDIGLYFEHFEAGFVISKTLKMLNS